MKLIETRRRSEFSYTEEAGDTPLFFLTYAEINTLGDVQALLERP